ncbi:hypothetical protein GCM10011376_18560 [Nocardioides flavus (ex Wang et al. 2016)]|uniref:Uncharacterized protein n=1 Tax=Nocardioides flavus (ex Wang et al. 2016) TaxID=2058780 RepID=A0ABQ3HI68_9ACTN|nr:hypothetical protein [Nocardioides flavus (ex Wang et al. 2016)]GHE17246.1 hypothetical protein GCM10011376_18560 [Nocardioides flavus (ex Wang et al. 2016)]
MPGWVTGKLSDVAGLVVAPLLMAAVLAVVRTPRALPVSLLATGAGFAFCKTSDLGAAVTSSVWSLFGTPTMIRADVTDLVALPALYAAWRIHRTVKTSAPRGWRRTVAVAVGTALLPVGVLATSATSCDESGGITRVGVVQGELIGPPRGVETRLVGGGLYGLDFSIDGRGSFRDVDFELAGGVLSTSRRACVEQQCWRLRDDDGVDVSTDGGRTWVGEAELTVADRERIEEEVGTDDGCDGEPPRVGVADVAALEVDGAVRAIVALQHGGIWERQVDGTWMVLTPLDLHAARSEDRPPPPQVTEVDTPDPPEGSGGPEP